jgi:hypothetical protein
VTNSAVMNNPSTTTVWAVPQRCGASCSALLCGAVRGQCLVLSQVPQVCRFRLAETGTLLDPRGRRKIAIMISDDLSLASSGIQLLACGRLHLPITFVTRSARGADKRRGLLKGNESI